MAWGADADAAAAVARSHFHSPDEETSLDLGIQAGCCDTLSLILLLPLVPILLLVLVLVLVLVQACLRIWAGNQSACGAVIPRGMADNTLVLAPELELMTDHEGRLGRCTSPAYSAEK